MEDTTLFYLGIAVIALIVASFFPPLIQFIPYAIGSVILTILLLVFLSLFRIRLDDTQRLILFAVTLFIGTLSMKK